MCPIIYIACSVKRLRLIMETQSSSCTVLDRSATRCSHIRLLHFSIQPLLWLCYLLHICCLVLSSSFSNFANTNSVEAATVMPHSVLKLLPSDSAISYQYFFPSVFFSRALKVLLIGRIESLTALFLPLVQSNLPVMLAVVGDLEFRQYWTHSSKYNL